MPGWGIAVSTGLITENWFLFKRQLATRVRGRFINLERVVGCLGRTLASSNSSKNWHGVSFYDMPRIVAGVLMSRNTRY